MRAAEPGAQPHGHRRVERGVRDRLPDAQRQVAARLELLPQAQRAEPAVLVVHRGDAARVRKANAGAHRVEVVAVGDDHVALLEVPGRLLAEHPRRLARFVPLDDAARHVEVAAGERERRRVQPERVVVLRDQPGRRVAGDRIEIVPGRLALRLPVAASPAVAAQPAARLKLDTADPFERLFEARAPVERDLGLRERPGREVNVRVGEAGHDDTAAEVEHVGRRERRLVHADAARDELARDRERPLGRNLRVERADEAVREDHRFARIYACSTT